MPEGDTLYKLALKLRPRLLAEVIEECRLRDRGRLPALVGVSISAVESRGKNLLIALGERSLIRIHLGMKGAVRCFERRDMRPASRGAASVIRTARWDVLMNEQTRAELVRRIDLERGDVLGDLGPDLLIEPVDFAEIVRRAQSPERVREPLGELLLDQRVAAGVGNVYKNEVLFMARLSPWTRVEELSAGQLETVYRLCRDLLRSNLGPGFRRFVSTHTRTWEASKGETRLWVYQQTSRGCLVCGGEVRFARQGPRARGTYWCPRCQPG